MSMNFMVYPLGILGFWVGKIFISNFDEVIRIRTGETGKAAI